MKRILAYACCGVFSLGGAANASMSLDIAGLSNPHVTAEVNFGYQSISDTLARLTIAIHNTTPVSLGGRITAFAFNVPTLTGVDFVRLGGDMDDGRRQRVTGLHAPNEHGWFARLDLGHIKTPNHAGDFDFGVMNNDHTEAFITDGVGGRKAPRIVVGETTTFTVNVSGRGLDNFANSIFESAFLSELSTGGGAGAYSFAVRFQGIQGDKSDLGVPMEVVPLPPSLLLAFFGLTSAGLCMRKSKNH